jgi:flagellar hook-basal body complex protein FliE
MSIDAISGLAASAVSALQPMAEAAPAASTELHFPEPAAAPDGVSFDSLVDSIDALNQKLVASTDAVHAMALGQVDNLHQSMMSGEQTRLAFDLMLQVRGKVLDAYQELLRMQV